jgi:hypothetical protein
MRPIDGMTAPYIRAFVRMIHAAVAQLEGKCEVARDQLAGTIGDADACKMASISALGRLRLAQLTGDAAGADEARAALARCGVVDTERFARVFATWP